MNTVGTILQRYRMIIPPFYTESSIVDVVALFSYPTCVPSGKSFQSCMVQKVWIRVIVHIIRREGLYNQVGDPVI